MVWLLPEKFKINDQRRHDLHMEGGGGRFDPEYGSLVNY